MAKRKLLSFAENESFPHFFQPRYHEIKDGFSLKSAWNESYFKNDGPITLELGCGKAEFSYYLAGKYPERNFVGIDLKGARLWRGAKDSFENKMNNIAFIRSHVQNVNHFFGPQEVEEIWIPFPDPQLHKPGERKRLTSSGFLKRYADVLKPDHIIHLKTDNRPFFEYTLETIASGGHQLLFSTFDLYNENVDYDAVKVQTFYEKQFLDQGMEIKYLQFRLNNA
ncbi:MAG: tRNA (guanosine(46)-N7)-methyltransferase TrmB [Bacteroidales bacterium]|nr:tRNA (guanosine(46)-N7)-methyltransferase TrmB [Bacteroidales bacterium]